MPSESTSFTATLTRRMRSLIERHQIPRPRPDLPFLTVQIPLGLVEQPLGLARLARDAGDGEARALPQLVVVDLGDGRAEAVLQLRLGRPDEPTLALQRARFREMELDREDADVARAHREPFCRGACTRRARVKLGAVPSLTPTHPGK